MTSRRRLTALGAVFGIAGLLGTTALTDVWAQAIVEVRPGDDVARMAARAGEGATLRFAPGIYRGQTILAQDGQRFVGPEDGSAVLSGARVLTDFQQDGGRWVARSASPAPRAHGECESDRPLCQARENLFLDGDRLERVASRGRVGPGTWYYDQRRVVMGDDPTGRLVELSVTPIAFRGGGDGVEIRHLTVEKYNPGAQEGAITAKGTKDWRIVDVTARWNHGLGLHLGDRTHVQGGRFVHNGQMGMRSEWGSGVVEGAEIAHNNFAGYSGGWEAGGTKFLEMTALTVRGTCVHNNVGAGLWTDANNTNVLYEDNLVFDNWGDGIKHEISYQAVIRNNTVVGNGFGYDPWLWGSQILVQNSSDTEVTGNWVETSDRGGNGIAIIHQDRTSRGGRWVSENIHIHGNTVVLRGDALTGMGADFDRDWFWGEANNRLTANTYVLVGAARSFLEAYGRKDLARAQNEGRELGSTLRVEQTRASMVPACANRR